MNSLIILLLFSFIQFTTITTIQAAQNTVAGCAIFPANSIFNTPIDNLPVHAKSAQWMALFSANRKLHPDFGTQYEYPTGTWNQMGIPYVVVDNTQPLVGVEYDSLGGWPDQSDAGPMPIPHNPAKEKPDIPDGDSHVLVLRKSDCKLFELYYAQENADQSWSAMSGVIWDLASNQKRPLGYTSADASGFALMPLLVRYDELYGPTDIDHAIRMTITSSYIHGYVWPGSHVTSSSVNGPPYGTRFRLKASYVPPVSFPEPILKFVRAMKKYGLIVADGGSDFYVSGTHDDQWDDSILDFIKQIPVQSFEVVDHSSLMVDMMSFEAKQTSGGTTAPTTKTPTTKTPTHNPTHKPSKKPSKRPTRKPTRKPTKRPTKHPGVTTG
jgi:hypothetical protein